MIKKLFVLVAFSMINLFSISAQVQSRITPLKIGDNVPNFIVGIAVNNAKKNINLTDYKGKLLILDFWSIHCAPCVAALPELNKLQIKFKDKVNILPVGINSGDEIMKFFTYAKINLPSIVKDTMLRKMFPHKTEPHEVWINEDGKVIAITHSKDVNEANIEEYLKTKVITSEEKIEMPFDDKIPLFVNGNGGMGDTFKYRSIITDQIKNLGSKSTSDRYWETTGKNFKSITLTNLSLPIIYSHVLTMYRIPTTFIPSRTIIETRDSIFQPMNYFSNGGSLKLPGFNDSLLYCYNLNLPYPGTTDSIFFRKYMLEDLNRVFNLNARIERRLVQTWTIIRSKKVDNKTPITKLVGTVDYSFNSANHETLIRVKNMSFSSFLRYMQIYYYASPLIINETGYSNELIDMELNIDYFKNKAYSKPLRLDVWKNAFQKYGLDIVEGKKETEVLVLTIPDKETPSK